MRAFSALGIAIGAWFGGEHSAAATVNIDIDFSRQRMNVVSELGRATIGHFVGPSGPRTPRGVFAPQQMYKMVHSWKYGNTPMPHAIFFYGNFAIHGTDAVWACSAMSASHGCVRLSEEDAATLYGLVEHEGARIAISGGANSPGVAENPHKAGHRLAFEQRKRMKHQALGYAPGERLRTLKEWLKNPVGTH